MSENTKKILTYVIYTLIIIGIFGMLLWFGNFKSFQSFMSKIEASSFDLRQNMIIGHKKPNKNIEIIAIDDATYEYIMNNYGSWPISRQIWSDVSEFIELGQPKNIVYDLLFVKSNLNDKKADSNFVKTIKKHDNIFLSMNFDNYDERIRKAADLDDKFKLNLKEGSLADSTYVTFINSRNIMPELAEVTKNVGSINVTREADGVIRNTTPIFKYKGDYYPNLSLAVAMDYLGANSVSIKNNNIIIDENHTIPLDNTQRAIINWYGKRMTYKHIPLWEVIEASKTKDIKFTQKFKDKIIYIGTTATSLADVKTVPVEYNLAGVEIHTTFLNNVLDNNFIKKTSSKVDFIVAILISIFLGYCILKIASVFKTIALLLITLGTYFAISVILMQYANLWIGVVLPFISTITTFVLIYCEKYILKSKDYEKTYKLAVTDGLTQLYNHRYFQEQMINNVNTYNRYGVQFSLILIDIDFFKKFNDTYGHQSGDCVLKQVANILKKNSRTSDIACRYGGEEMAIILTNTLKEDAITTANKVCLAVRNNKFILTNGEKVNVTISVGVATIGDDGKKPQEMIEYADKCLYIAKENGRNQVVHQAN